MPRRNDDPPKMPEAYKGRELVQHKEHLSRPREWTEEEKEWAWQLREAGYSSRQIGQSTGRTTDSIKIKMKRIKKDKGIYGDKSQVGKYERNRAFYKQILPETIADVYCGVENYWRNAHPDAAVTTNDKDPKVDADSNDDALVFLCRQYAAGNKYDLIDLDPYGSAHECLDIAIKLADKGLIVTLGELGHRRFKRLDYVRYRYNIDSLADFTAGRLINEIQKIGRRNKKELRVSEYQEWQNVARVWFDIQPYKNRDAWKPKEG